MVRTSLSADVFRLGGQASRSLPAHSSVVRKPSLMRLSPAQRRVHAAPKSKFLSVQAKDITTGLRKLLE